MENIIIVQHNVQHWNTRKFNLSQTYFSINPHIILINSHGMKEQEPLKLQGYTTYKVNSRQELNDGSAIMVKNNIKHKIDNNYITDILEIIIETDIGEVGIATTYIPPRREFLPFPDFHRLATKHRPTYIIGDLNAGLDRQRQNNKVGKGLQRFFDKGTLTHLGPDFTTYHERGSSTTPDIILGNNKTIHNITMKAGPLTESDHLPIIMTITSKAITNPITPRPNPSRADWDKFNDKVEELINNIVITDNMTPVHIDTAIETWYNAIQTGMNISMPTIRRETTQKPISSPLLRYIQHQHQQLLQASQTHGWSLQNFLRYRMLKIMLKNETRNIKNDNWKSTLERTALKYNDPKAFWKKIKQLKGSKTQPNQYLQNNNMIITRDRDKEESFRLIWQDVFKISPQENVAYDGEKEAEVERYLVEHPDKITTFPRSDLSRLQGTNQIDSLITQTEIDNVIKRFKNNTPGETNINKAILNKLPNRAITILQTIFNHTLSLGYFPTKFKTALIKMIHKANTDCTDPKNYRPISLLEVPGKILEKIINKRLREFLETHTIITDKQHGFRAARGTDTALTTIHETIAHHVAQRSQCYIVLRDVSKAFDKVWHKGLQYKISLLELPSVFTKLINNFFTNRTAKIKIGNFIGPPFPLTAGVPQGSSISPTLYTIYTNDIPDPAIDCATIQYADDITQIITYHGKSRHLMVNRTVSEIQKINEFERLWKIKTNKNKFKIVPICVKKKFDITIDGNVIPYSNYGKVLGVKIGTSGYNKHIQETADKGKRALRELQRFYDLPHRIKLHLVKAFIRPILTYAPIPSITVSNSNLKKLQVIQNRGLRFAYNERYPYTRNTKTLHELANIEPINYTVYVQADKIFDKLRNRGDEQFSILLDDYDERKNHQWFRKVKIILDGGIPEKIYTG